MNTLIAHSPKDPAHRAQPYNEHSQQVADLARSHAELFGAGDWAWLAGQIHDLGKIHPRWQAYVKGLNGKIPHADAGAVALAEHPELAALALIVAGHHTGIPALTEFRVKLSSLRKEPRIQTILELARMNDQLSDFSNFNTPSILLEQPDEYNTEFFLRMLYSALVDADALDTEHYYYPNSVTRRAAPNINAFPPLLDSHLFRLQHKANGLVNEARTEILRACRQAADQPQGIFRLTVPTGGGKTLSSLAFALDHAIHYDLRGVIVAIPFISIIDQTVKVFRDVFANLGSHAILEHHSSLPSGREDQWSRLAAENWEAPLVVTTTVQLFESLLGQRPSVCRKLHNLAGSVIIVDEFQALPLRLWDPILSVLKELVAHYSVTVVLSTATQPPSRGFNSRWDLEGVKEIVPFPTHYFARLARVEYQEEGKDSPWTPEKLASEIIIHPRVLVVVNTTAQVRDLVERLRLSGEDQGDLFALSTRLCGRHRLQVIELVRTRLIAGSSCRLISTQVIEAGVDLDFPVGFRLLAPLVSIVQSAGRVNREGRQYKGILHVVHYADRRMPMQGGYHAAADLTRNLLAASSINWHDPALYDLYFDRVLQQTDDGLSQKIQSARHDLDYPRIAELFRLIPDDTQPVVVLFGSVDEKARIVEWLDNLPKTSTRESLRRLQPYMVNLRPREYERCLRAGIICEYPLSPKLGESALGLWKGSYDPLLGLTEESPIEDYFI